MEVAGVRQRNEEEFNLNHDLDIETAIRSAMVHDPRLSAQAIQVSVQNGVVRLTGTVQSFRRALAAYEIATAATGVREVVNGLEVGSPGELPDLEIADHVRAALEASADVCKSAITVLVSNGQATLSGNVADAWQFAIAEDIARSARGVRDVRNLLAMNLTDLVNDEETALVIREAILRACGLPAENIRVAVSNRAVVLSGTTETLPQKEFAREVVRRRGFLEIRNDIQVMLRE